MNKHWAKNNTARGEKRNPGRVATDSSQRRISVTGDPVAGESMRWLRSWIRFLGQMGRRCSKTLQQLAQMINV
jgi:hypothetical protein